MWAIKGQAIAIALVIASGVGTFVMSLNTLKSLDRSKQMYYEKYRFAHVWSHVKRAPLSLARRIEVIPGVSQVQTRVVVEVTLDVRGMSEPAIGRLISIPEHRTPMVNDLHLRRGRWIEPHRDGEALVSEAFAGSHRLQIGETVTAVINGRRQKLTIVGIVLSPEYIIQIHGANLLPDDRRFGIFWVGYEQLASAFNLDGAFNNVALTLSRGAIEREAIQRLDDLTKRYGGRGASGREEHVSHRYISDEIRQLRSLGLIAPSIFFSVAAFLLNVVLTRLISVQREQIAALKAFGYTRLQIGLHYIKLVLLISLVGTVLGIVVGSVLGRSLTHMYTQLYRFPVFGFEWNASVVLGALLISSTAAVAGTLLAVRRAVRLPPAEAMRPEPPAVYRPTLLDRSGLGELLPQAARMVFRELERKPVKAAMSCVGISMAVAILILGSFTLDSINYIIDFQFGLSQRQDLLVAFAEPTTAGSLYDLQHLPGVIRCEPIRSAATRFHFGHRTRRVGIIGLNPGGQLYRLLDENERLVSVPRDGLLLSSKLAELLHVRLGDRVLVEVLEGEQPIREVPVSALVTEYGGTNAYMDAGALHRLLREGETLTGAFLMVQGDRMEELYRTLKNTPHVAGVTIKEASVKSFQDTIAENLGYIRLFNVLFAIVIAVRRGLQQRPDFAGRAEPRPGDAARDRLYADRDFRHPAGRVGGAYAGRYSAGAGRWLPVRGLGRPGIGYGSVSRAADYSPGDVRLCRGRGARRGRRFGAAGPGTAGPFGLDCRAQDTRVRRVIKFLVRTFGFLIVIGAIAGGLLWSFWPQPVDVEMAAATRGPLRVTVDEDGKTRIKERYIVAAPLTGRLLRIELDAGDAVTRGETLLATIEPNPPEILDVRAVAQAEARVKAAQAALDRAQPLIERAREELSFAQSELARFQKLAKTESASKRDVEQAQMLYRSRMQDYSAARFAQDIAQFELETAQAALVLVQPAQDGPADDRRLPIKAPIDGQVLRLFQESAIVVRPGDRLLELGDPADLEVEVDVLSSDAVKIQPGAKALLEQWGGEDPLPATVRLIEPSAFLKVSALGVEEQRVNVILDLDDPPEKRRALGDAFRVEARIVIWEQDDVLQVPTGALFRHGDRWSVFAVANNVARLRTVGIGHRNSLAAEVVSGLQAGEQVILHPSDKVRDGAQVNPRDLNCALATLAEITTRQ